MNWHTDRKSEKANKTSSAMASQPALERRETGETPVAAAPLVAQEDLTSAGQPLDDATRAFFESRFDHDFSRVRVHTDVASTRELNAAAFTLDSDLFFSPGAYRPQTLQGQQLIAHELTHVMQYEASPPREGARQTSRTEDASERQADSFLKHMALGLPVTGITPVAPSAVLSLAPETWFRGEAEGVGSIAGSRVEGGHDLGDGLYLTNEVSVAEEYADARVEQYKLPPTARRVLGTEIDLDKVGPVLDLTKDERWERFLNRPAIPNVPNYPTNGELMKTQRNFGSFFQQFCREEKINLDDYKVIIGPEKVRGGKQMCIRDPALRAQVRASLGPLKPGGGGGGRGPGSAGGGEPGEGEVPSRRPPAKGAGRPGGPSAVGEAEEPEKVTPRATRRTTAGGRGADHMPQVTVRRMAASMALNIGAAVSVGIFQSWFKEKVLRDLEALPKPNIDKRSAAGFLEDPNVKSSMSLLDLFGKHFKPLGQELQNNQQVINTNVTVELIGIALMADKTPADVERKLERLAALQDELSEYEGVLTTMRDNLEAILEMEERALESKRAADSLLAFLKSGLVLSWLIHMGFSVDEISAMESNLLNLSVSIDIAFREAHALKAIVDKMFEDSYSLSSGVNKLWWSEFGRQLDWHLKERQKQREQAEATRRRQAEKRAAETTPKADQPRFRNADEMGIYYDLRARESELMQQLAEVDKKAAALPPGTSSSDLQEQREDLLIQLKQVRAKLQTYQVQSRP